MPAPKADRVYGDSAREIGLTPTTCSYGKMSSLRNNLRPVLAQLRAIRYNCRRLCSVVDPLPVPEAGSDKNYPEKISRIVEDISKLTLLETAQLNELLKSTLNIQDVPMMTTGVIPAVATQADEEVKKEEEQTEFLVRLVKFADDSKIKVIKEIKGVMEGINLVQAKKFVEELPQIVKQGINKEDATKLKERLEAAGGVVEVV